MTTLSNQKIFDVLVDSVAAALATKLKPLFEAARVQARLLSVEQAAIYLGRTDRAVEAMIANQKLPAVRSDRRVMLDVRDLDRWIEQNKTEAE